MKKQPEFHKYLPHEGPNSPRNAWLRTGWLVEIADQAAGVVGFKRAG